MESLEFTCTVADQHHHFVFYNGIAPIAQSLNGKPSLDPILA